MGLDTGLEILQKNRHATLFWEDVRLEISSEELPSGWIWHHPKNSAILALLCLQKLIRLALACVLDQYTILLFDKRLEFCLPYIAFVAQGCGIESVGCGLFSQMGKICALPYI